MRVPSLRAFTLVAAAFAATSAQAANPQPQPIEVSGRQLLATLDDGNGHVAVRQASTIPYVVGRSCYNWVVRFKPVARQIVLSEELTLPAGAPVWNDDPDQPSRVAGDRASAVTERRFDGAEGQASGGWCIAEGDPVGTYRFVISESGGEIARFTFTVGDLI